MYYEINVSLNGQHFFATAERSVDTLGKARTLVAIFRQTFPKANGYAITVTQWETLGRTIDLDIIDPPTPPVVTPAVVTPALSHWEKRVLKACLADAEGNGGDFGIIENLTVRGLSQPSLAVVLDSLQAKHIITVHERIFNGTDHVTQFTFDNR